MYSSVAKYSMPLLLPLAAHRVPAGFPSPATDYLEDGLDLNAYLVQHPAATFLFSVQGHSMQGAGILDGDKVVVDRAVDARHGHIVVATVDGEFTLKRLYQRHNRVELHPENPAFPPIQFTGSTQLQIWGVVVGVVRRY
ncbi:MAG: translesion error-prone DNA polymerase V autoproteolytic subunit [Xylophilus sp.]|nr:translesion error-prone DNA polymerase V autoproteolytic subunit [Burkholderiaceae bacterium]MBP7421155.1 translesion error-prone DNA polymerase V autoproteolytic subunit [Burkholderiaceae bacterium]MBP8229593.1 translesion error-prone DNA polymerase V autoproteolytic subunit [Xylophilus sp.]